MTIDQLTAEVVRVMGYQAYVASWIKGFDQPRNPDPFHKSARPDGMTYYQRIEVGLTTLHGNDPIVFDVTPDLVYQKIKAAAPQLKWG